MIENLRFLSSAFGAAPHGTAFLSVRDGYGLAYNGRLAMSAPVEVGFDCQPQGKAFLRAVEACKSTFALHLTETGSLVVSEDGFRVTVPCSLEELPLWQPAPARHKIGFPLLPILKTLSPFIGTDPFRLWTNGVLLKGQSAFATNNPVLLEHWLPDVLPFSVCLPGEAVRELLRIGEEPESVGLSDSQVTFYFSGQRWLSCRLYETEWPDVGEMLDKAFAEFNEMELSEEFWEGLERLLPLAEGDKKVWLNPHCLSTSGSPENYGASVEIPDELCGTCHNGPLLLSVRPFAQLVSFSDNMIFHNETVRGMLAGIRP